MLVKHLLPLFVVGTVSAQSLVDILSAQNQTLSALAGILQRHPELLSTLGGLHDITVLAPSNEAFAKLLNDPAVASAVESEPSLISALLSYHVLNGTYYASNLTGSSTPLFIPTLLTNPVFSTVSGGQRVEVQSSDGSVIITSGNGAQSKVQSANFNFTGGTLHIIDSVLTIPPNITSALAANNLTALAGAATQAGLVQALSDTAELTLFAPNNQAFAAISDVASSLTIDQLAAVLGYHVIEGAVVYSVDVTNGMTATTAQGTNVTFRVDNGAVYVNNARVVKPDVLVKNGVVHVIDSVLIPKGGPTQNATGTATTSSPSGTATSFATGTSSVVPGVGAISGQGAAWAAVFFSSMAAVMSGYM